MVFALASTPGPVFRSPLPPEPPPPLEPVPHAATPIAIVPAAQTAASLRILTLPMSPLSYRLAGFPLTTLRPCPPAHRRAAAWTRHGGRARPPRAAPRRRRR